MSYSHSDSDITQLIAAYDEVLPLLKRSVEGATLEQDLRCQPLKPLFAIR